MSLSVETRPVPTPRYDDVDRQRAAYDDASTWFAEVIPGSLRVPVEFHFDGHELYGRDGRPMAPIFKNAVVAAEMIADAHPNLVFELHRRFVDWGEYKDMLAMARHEAPNTMVVVSDFPAELQDATRDVGGYNISRKQTMLRVITRRSDGRLSMTNQSLDRSDRAALEAIYAHFNLRPQKGELLGQRIHVDISEEEQPYLIDRLMGMYDRKLTENYGGSWYAGRPGEDAPDTYDFVKRQHDLLARFVGTLLTNQGSKEDLYHDVAATMAKRLSKHVHGEVSVENLYVQSGRLEQEIAQAAAEARALGLVFSACGGSVGADTEKQLQQTGYGNQTNESTSYSFDKKMYCVVCQAPPPKNEKPKMCGPCGICKTCDFRLKVKTQAV